MKKETEEVSVFETKEYDKFSNVLGADLAKEFMAMKPDRLKDELATAEVKMAETNKRYKLSDEYIKASEVKKTFDGALKDRLKEVNATTGIAALLLSGVNQEDAESTKEYKKAQRVIGKKKMPEFLTKGKAHFEALIVGNEVHKASLTRERDSNSQYASAVSVKKELNSAILSDNKGPKVVVAFTTLLLGNTAK